MSLFWPSFLGPEVNPSAEIILVQPFCSAQETIVFTKSFVISLGGVNSLTQTTT